MTKQEMIEAVGLEEFDWARPMEWDQKARELGINPDDYVWSYENSVVGEPYNIYAEYIRECDQMHMS